jgi:hypothetical protein
MSVLSSLETSSSPASPSSCLEPYGRWLGLTTESKVQEMCRHITGVEQPAKKIKLDNNEKLERKRTYDQVKRKRKFQTS